MLLQYDVEVYKIVSNIKQLILNWKDSNKHIKFLFILDHMVLQNKPNLDLHRYKSVLKIEASFFTKIDCPWELIESCLINY